MPEQAEQPGNAKDHARLRSLMDKIVAVQLDLKSLCRDGSPRVDPDRIQTTLAAACAVLQLAIEELRDVIHRLDGPTESRLPTPRTARELPSDD